MESLAIMEVDWKKSNDLIPILLILLIVINFTLWIFIVDLLRFHAYLKYLGMSTYEHLMMEAAKEVSKRLNLPIVIK